MSNQTECVECGYVCHKNYFGSHLRVKHNKSFQEYYDLYLRKQDEGKCLICKKSTSFRQGGVGYLKTCSRKCAYVFSSAMLQKTEGVKNRFELQPIKEKSKQTLLQKYGVDNPSKLQDVKDKKKATCFQNYGVDNPSQAKNILAKKQETWQEKYGASNPMHHKEIAAKAALNGGGRAKAKRYRTKFGKDIIVQGSYEKLFVDYCESNNIDVENGPCVEYEHNGEKHRYFPDFQVEVNGKKKIVEIKSTYWYSKFKDLVDAKNQAAKEYCSQNSYEFVFIINDNNNKKLNCKKFEKVKE